MYNLSNRLRVIAESVPIGSKVADIGTDHAYLPVFLSLNKISNRILACDINQKPLENAKKNIALSGAENIETRLCDGLNGITKDEVDTIIIAGMGGEVIAAILSDCDWIKAHGYTLILQPMTSPEYLRRFLYNNGFEIVKETAIQDSCKLYSVMTVIFSGKFETKPEYFYFAGMLNRSDETAQKYIQKQIKRIKKCRDDLKNVATKDTEYGYYKKLFNDLTDLLQEG